MNDPSSLQLGRRRGTYCLHPEGLKFFFPFLVCSRWERPMQCRKMHVIGSLKQFEWFSVIIIRLVPPRPHSSPVSQSPPSCSPGTMLWEEGGRHTLICILFSGSAQWLNFHQNLAKFHLEMNSFTSQTTDESRLKSFRFFSANLPRNDIQFFSRFEWHGASCMACSRPVVATRIMWSIRNCHLFFFSNRGPLEHKHSHTQNHLYSVSIDGSS